MAVLRKATWSPDNHTITRDSPFHSVTPVHNLSLVHDLVRVPDLTPLLNLPSLCELVPFADKGLVFTSLNERKASRFRNNAKARGQLSNITRDRFANQRQQLTSSNQRFYYTPWLQHPRPRYFTSRKLPPLVGSWNSTREDIAQPSSFPKARENSRPNRILPITVSTTNVPHHPLLSSLSTPATHRSRPLRTRNQNYNPYPRSRGSDSHKPRLPAAKTRWNNISYSDLLMHPKFLFLLEYWSSRARDFGRIAHNHPSPLSTYAYTGPGTPGSLLMLTSHEYVRNLEVVVMYMFAKATRSTDVKNVVAGQREIYRRMAEVIDQDMRVIYEHYRLGKSGKLRLRLLPSP